MRSTAAVTARIAARMERRNRKAYIMTCLGGERWAAGNQAESWFDHASEDREAMFNVEWGICFRDPHARRPGRP